MRRSGALLIHRSDVRIDTQQSDGRSSAPTRSRTRRWRSRSGSSTCFAPRRARASCASSRARCASTPPTRRRCGSWCATASRRRTSARTSSTRPPSRPRSSRAEEVAGGARTMEMGALASVFWLVAYAWPHAAAAETLEARFAPPPGAARVAVADGSFGDFLRAAAAQAARRRGAPVRRQRQAAPGRARRGRRSRRAAARSAAVRRRGDAAVGRVSLRARRDRRVPSRSRASRARSASTRARRSARLRQLAHPRVRRRRLGLAAGGAARGGAARCSRATCSSRAAIPATRCWCSTWPSVATAGAGSCSGRATCRRRSSTCCAISRPPRRGTTPRRWRPACETPEWRPFFARDVRRF